jgi:hypothetical protein
MVLGVEIDSIGKCQEHNNALGGSPTLDYAMRLA